LNFSRTAEPILTKVGTNHPWVKGILIVQIKGNLLVQGEILKQVCENTLKFVDIGSREEDLIFLSRTSNPISIKPGTNHPLVK
jgi:hypothetical protein